jgi:16S rRNA (cytosine967-C5)-methyltransferase
MPGETIWDACAGAGGKTLQIAASMGGGGAVYATDLREHALDECRKRSKRAGLNNVRIRVWDGITPPPLPKPAAARGGFDAVLVDAPCSSSGTWRRNPEARYRLTPSLIDGFASTQRNLLNTTAPLVREGGRLCYSTCSWLPQENELVVKAFLESPIGLAFSLASQSMLGLPNQDSDSMFVAVLLRKLQKH